jgi:TolA-binding protein
MKKPPFLILSFAALVSLPACVTTRQQLNEERGLTSDGSASSSTPHSVASEDLSPRAEPQTAEAQKSDAQKSEPQLVATPPTQSSTPATVAPPAGSYTLEEIRAEMARLSGKVEELEHEKKLREEQRAEEQKKLQDKIAELETKLKETAGPAVPEGKTPFQAGKDAYFNERFEEAIAFFDQALKSKDTGKEAEEAFYIQGESYFKLKNYQKAIVNYSKFPEKFTKSSYHPKALLRIAECFDAMGMKEDGKAFYQNLLDQFPKTAEGKIAKKRLAAPTATPKKTKL